jgi:hypothetical protein
MALSNAERQKRWRDKRNALATAAVAGQQQLRNDTEFIERYYQGRLDWALARIRELEQELDEAARARVRAFEEQSARPKPKRDKLAGLLYPSPTQPKGRGIKQLDDPSRPRNRR